MTLSARHTHHLRPLALLLIVAFTAGCTTTRSRRLQAVPAQPDALDGEIVGVVLRDGTEVTFASPASMEDAGSIAGMVATDKAEPLAASSEPARFPAGEIRQLVLELTSRTPDWPLIAAGAAAGLTVLFFLIRNWADQFE